MAIYVHGINYSFDSDDLIARLKNDIKLVNRFIISSLDPILYRIGNFFYFLGKKGCKCSKTVVY